VAGTVIVAWDPADLFNVGFVLSFVTVAGMIVLTRPVRDILGDAYGAAADRLRGAWPRARAAEAVPLPWETDRFAPDSAGSWRGRLAAAGRAMGDTAAISIAVWLVSTPLTAFYFGRFVPVALISNLIAVPLSFLALLCGTLSLVAGSVLPWTGEVFNNANLALVECMLWATDWMGRVPGGSVRVEPPPAGWVWAWLAALAAAVYAWRRRAVERECAVWSLANR
jgi:MYXO-CTERM domain-containing protein